MNANTTLTCCFLLLLSVQPRLQSQNFRNAEAYLSDFGKNERYITESLVAYSSSLINGEKESRTHATVQTIYKKLQNINAIVTRNDKGFEGDTSLRDTFLKMNHATLVLLDDNTLKLDDYEAQRHLSFDEIFNDFDLRKRNIINYYSLIVDYTNAKRRFSRRNDVKQDRYFSNRDIFEYNSHQSLIFFKINVLDAKLSDLLSTTDEASVTKCIAYLDQISEESLVQIDDYTKVNVDQSLNLATQALIHFVQQRNELILPLYKDYVASLSNFSNTDKASASDDVREKLGELEKQLNVAKTKLDEQLALAQTKKKALVDKWIETERSLLQNKL